MRQNGHRNGGVRFSKQKTVQLFHDASSLLQKILITVRIDIDSGIKMSLPNTLRWPLKENRIRRGMLNHTFGYVRKYANGNPKAHQGWDFYAPDGTDCYAVASGKISAIQYNHADWGNLVVIELTDVKHQGQKIYAAYAHLSTVLVSSGATIAIGQKIGKSGTTGNASGMKGEDQHLHFEIRTQSLPGRGLGGRISPLQLYGQPPLHTSKVDLRFIQ